MRPKRLYLDKDKDEFFYMIGGKKRKIKRDKKMSQKQIQKVNIVNVIGELQGKRLKPKRRAKRVYFSKKIVEEQKPVPKTGIDAFYTPSRYVPSLGDIQSNIKNTKDDDPNKLKKDILELLQGKPVLPALPAPSSPLQKPPLAITIGDQQTPLATRRPSKEKELIERVGATESKEPEVLALPTSKATFFSVGDLISKLDRLFKDEYPTMTQFYKKYNEEGGKKKRIPDDLMLQIANTFRKEREKSENERQYATEDQAERSYNRKKGKGNGDTGMYNDEITNFLQKETNMYVPVIATDELNKLFQHIKPNMKKFAFVINTVPSQADGTGTDGYPSGHWRTVFIDNRDDYPSIEWFDPLGGPPEKSIVKALKKMATTINPERLFLFKQNMMKRQNDVSSNCGQFCIKFIDDRNRGVPFSKATGYDDYMKEKGPVDDSSDGEQDIEEYKNQKFNRYI